MESEEGIRGILFAFETIYRTTDRPLPLTEAANIMQKCWRIVMGEKEGDAALFLLYENAIAVFSHAKMA